MLRKLIIALIAVVMTGCATPELYKKADLSWYGGRIGYLEKEIRPGIYILEYSHIGGYNFNLELNKTYWKKRALELCPKGYDGSYEIIHPAYAKIPDFECPQAFCGKYPLLLNCPAWTSLRDDSVQL